MAVVASATGATVFGLSGVAAGLAGGALLGAGAGALYSGITGDGNILNSALTGGLIGGGVGGLGAALGPTLMGTAGGATALAPTVGGTTGLAAATPEVVAGAANTPALASAALNSAPAYSGASAFGGAGGASVNALGEAVAPAVVQGAAPVSAGSLMTTDAASFGPGWSSAGFNGGPGAAATGLTGGQMLGYGLAGTAALSLLGGMNQKKLTAGQYPGQSPMQIRPYTYNQTQNASAFPTGAQYGSNGLPILPTSQPSYFNQSYTAGTPYTAADGGLMSSPTPSMMQTGPADVNFMGSDMYPTSQQHRSYYATPTQMPTSAQEAMASYEPNTNPLTGEPTANMAKGGKAEDDGFSFDDLTKAQKEYYLNMMDAKFEIPKAQYVEGLGYQTPPPSVNGRLGINMDGLGGKIRAGMSGMAMQTPDKKILTTPGMMDIGYKSNKESAYDPTFDVSLQRAIKSAPGRNKDYALAANYTMPFANGGGIADAYNLGSYSDGGRLLKGPGDGVSDDIPAVIGDKQPARLADGEFVIPARIVSEIGNGSTDAGAKRLYAMMDKIQAGRAKTVGKGNVAKDTKAKKHLLA